MATITGDNKDNTLTGTPGNDRIAGLGGDDAIFGGAGDNRLLGDDGDDSIEGGDGRDILFGDAGDDVLEGGPGDDTMYGGDGRDRFIADGGDDEMFGGLGSDTFSILAAGEIGVIGGEDPDGGDVDVLDLRGGMPGIDYAEANVLYGGGNDEAGTVEFLDAAGAVIHRLRFREIERIICFTPGTLIATPAGERRVEDLKPGDRVFTRDNGSQHIRWTGQRTLPARTLIRDPILVPVTIRRGALGNGLPERDMQVSPSHRLLIASDEARLYFDEREVLVAAKHLVGMPGIERGGAATVTYCHFMCDHHEVVLSDGAWSESFQPGEHSLAGLDALQRTELLKVFPDAATVAGAASYIAARRTLKRHEARLLAG